MNEGDVLYLSIICPSKNGIENYKFDYHENRAHRTHRRHRKNIFITLRVRTCYHE
jgi:hypothetical protein